MVHDNWKLVFATFDLISTHSNNIVWSKINITSIYTYANCFAGCGAGRLLLLLFEVAMLISEMYTDWYEKKNYLYIFHDMNRMIEKNNVVSIVLQVILVCLVLSHLITSNI